jgi:hypothetical protein
MAKGNTAPKWHIAPAHKAAASAARPGTARRSRRALQVRLFSVIKYESVIHE